MSDWPLFQPVVLSALFIRTALMTRPSIAEGFVGKRALPASTTRAAPPATTGAAKLVPFKPPRYWSLAKLDGPPNALPPVGPSYSASVRSTPGAAISTAARALSMTVPLTPDDVLGRKNSLGDRL